MEKCIEETIRYAGKYGCRLSRQELKRRLISSQRWEDEELNKIIDKYETSLSEEPNPWFGIKLEKAEDLAKIIKNRFPLIKMMAISGSVASRYPNENDDIDIFFICQKDSLWISRLLVRLFIYFSRIPHRKLGESEKKDDFCFNLWLDEEGLSLPEDKQNQKNAVDSVLMITLFDRDRCYEKFFRDNSWIQKHCAQEYGKVEISEGERKNIKRNYILAIINYLVYWPQRWFMESKITSEIVGIKGAFFHNDYKC